MSPHSPADSPDVTSDHNPSHTAGSSSCEFVLARVCAEGHSTGTAVSLGNVLERHDDGDNIAIHLARCAHCRTVLQHEHAMLMRLTAYAERDRAPASLRNSIERLFTLS